MIAPTLILASALLQGLPPQTQAQPILLSTASAEVFGPGIQFEAFLGTQINEMGQILSYVDLSGPGVNEDNENALILIDDGDFVPVVRENQASPFGAPVGSMHFITDTILANDATIYFSSRLRIINPNSDFDGLWKYDNGSLTRILAEREPIGDSRYSLDGRPGTAQVSRNNGVVTGGRLGVPGLFSALMGERDEVVQLFQPSGNLPGLPDGVTYVGSLGKPGLTPSGALAFGAAIQGPGVTEQSDMAMFAERGGTLELVLRNGDLATAAGAGVKFSYFTSVAFNERRSLAFLSQLAGTGVNSGNDSSVWFEGGDVPQLVAREGATAPGFGGENVRFAEMGLPGLSGKDKVIFHSPLLTSGGIAEGLFSWDEVNGLEKVISTLDRVPGVDDELYFRTIGPSFVNGPGQIVFSGEACQGTDCFYGLWAQDANEQFRLVVAEGQEFQVGPGDWRVVRNFQYADNGWPTGNESGDRVILLDDGTLTFTAFFEDFSSGVFTIDTRAVPEPSTWSLVLLALTTCVVVRRLPQRQLSERETTQY